jgi:hypothetical protein
MIGQWIPTRIRNLDPVQAKQKQPQKVEKLGNFFFRKV